MTESKSITTSRRAASPVSVIRYDFPVRSTLWKGTSRMYAVIETGGKQYRVEQGDRVDVERLAAGELSLRPVLVVDGDGHGRLRAAGEVRVVTAHGPVEGAAGWLTW